ncbi:MAG: response regulator [bacterium]|nr:response regulator [bacterium]
MARADDSEGRREEIPALVHIDRNLTFGFSMIVLALMLTVTIVGASFYQRIARNNEERLQQTITLILADAINRVSFSGKYHARLLIEQITESQPRIVYLMIADDARHVLAHSDPERNDTALEGEELDIARTVFESGESHLRDLEVEDLHIREVAMPYHSGYDNAVTGVLFVGISTEQFMRAVAKTREQMGLLVAALLLASLCATYLLSKHFAGPVKSMAWQLKGILDYAPLLICITNRSREVLASSAALDTGSSSPPSPGVLSDELDEVLSDGRVLTQEATRQVGGDPVFLLTTSFPIVKRSDGVAEQACAIAMDITERKRAEEALRDSEELLRAIFNATADGVLVVDKEAGAVSHMNRQFVEMWGIPKEILERRDDREYVQAVLDRVEDPQGFRDRIRAIYQTSEESQDEIRLRDGRVFERLSCPLIREGKEVGRVWDFRDITEREEAEAERKRLEAQVLHTQKLESLGVLAGGIAHDFNNMLMAVMGNADCALAETPKNSAIGENLSAIAETAARAADLCRQLLAYSGRGRFVVETLDLSRLVARMTKMLEVTVSKKAELRYEFAQGLPPVEGDATQLNQITMNLITNASEALEGKSGVITIRTGARECGPDCLKESLLDQELPEGRYTYLEVSDTGCGMDTETRAKLFDPFFTTKSMGRGLGLSAVLGIVRAHGGTVSIESVPGQGTTFAVLLPVAASAGASLPELPPEPPVSSGALTGTVLLVDDERSVRAVARGMLERMGLTVLEARDGREAVEVFGEHASEVDCVLLDLTMPHMNGEEAFFELRKIRPDVTVVMSSGYSEHEIGQNLIDAGLAGFMQKPYRRADLMERMRQMLGKSEAS